MAPTYRMMPADFADTVRQTSSTAAIADHHDVPYQTARSWLSTHRKRTGTDTN
jgi:transposase-like protein